MAFSADPRVWEDDELRAWRETCRRFFEREAVPHQERWREQHGVDRELWTKAGEVGLLCCGAPAEYGGGGGTFAHELVVIEELARSLETGFGFGVHSSVVADYVVEYGDEVQKRAWLPRVASGDSIGAVAMTEPGAGSDLRGLRTKAVRVDGGYQLSGSKTFITNGGRAELILVVAVTDAGAGSRGLSLFMIDAADSPEGLLRGESIRKIGQHSSDTVELFFDDLMVPREALLGDEGSGLHYLMRQLPRERLVIAATAAAATSRAVELTVEYTKNREMFGSTLFGMQNTRFELAECATLAQVGQTFLDSCVVQHLSGGLDSATASMAKYWLTDVQCEVLDRCVQLFGGYGYVEEYPIARMYADARVQRIYGGANEVMKELIARSL
jgi:acyl-CoA dehydrogenase